MSCVVSESAGVSWFTCRCHACVVSESEAVVIVDDDDEDEDDDEAKQQRWSSLMERCKYELCSIHCLLCFLATCLLAHCVFTCSLVRGQRNYCFLWLIHVHGNFKKILYYNFYLDLS